MTFLNHNISIVGAGPGDPELLTIKAHKRLAVADVILHDALLGNEWETVIRPDAKTIFVGKVYGDGQDQTQRQEMINQHLLHFAKAGKQVVRLKTGDPMVFGRGAEEARFCQQNGLIYEMIPGVTAAFAASSDFGLPLTERHKSPMLLFCTGRRVKGTYTELDAVCSVIESGGTVSLYMAIKSLPEFSDELLSRKISASIQVAICSKVSQAESQSYQTTLGEVKAFLQKENPPTPAIILMGKYVLPVNGIQK